MSVVEVIFRKVGEVFNLGQTPPPSTSRNLENFRNIYFLYTRSQLLLLLYHATVFFIRHKSLQKLSTFRNFQLFIKEHTNTRRKKLQIAPLRKDRYYYQKMRWRAIFFTNNNKKATKDYKEGFSYDLKRGRSPPQLKYLTQFGDDLVGIVK